MSLLSKASRFLKKTVVGKAIMSATKNIPILSQGLDLVAGIGDTPKKKGTTAAIQSSPVVTQKNATMQKSDPSAQPSFVQKIMDYVKANPMIALAVVGTIGVGAYFIFKKKKGSAQAVRRRTAKPVPMQAAKRSKPKAASSNKGDLAARRLVWLAKARAVRKRNLKNK